MGANYSQPLTTTNISMNIHISLLQTLYDTQLSIFLK